MADTGSNANSDATTDNTKRLFTGPTRTLSLLIKRLCSVIPLIVAGGNPLYALEAPYTYAKLMPMFTISPIQTALSSLRFAGAKRPQQTPITPMNPITSTADNVTLSPQPQLLYGTSGSSVHVVSLKPGQQYTSTGSTGMQQEWVVMQGQVNTGTSKLRAGKYGAYKQFSAGQSAIAQNPSAKNTAKLLILSRHSGDNNPNTTAAKPVTETRPWGNFTVLADEPDYKLKELVVTPGGRLSLQRHEKRAEHWFILKGNPAITQGRKKTVYQPGDYVKIPRHSWHRIDNRNGSTDVVLVELQTGTYFGEDDIERKEDDYGRQ